jgi:acetate kinase
MGTRSGDIDPAIHFYLCRELGYTVDDVDRLLNKQSGLLGLTGVNDMREIHLMAEQGDANAQLARELFALRLKKYLGAYYAELGRVDAVVFTGGIGENDHWLRARVCQQLHTLGIDLDAAANRAASRTERVISDAASAVRVLVIPTNEELEIATQTWSCVNA